MKPLFVESCLCEQENKGRDLLPPTASFGEAQPKDASSYILMTHILTKFTPPVGNALPPHNTLRSNNDRMKLILCFSGTLLCLLPLLQGLHTGSDPEDDKENDGGLSEEVLSPADTTQPLEEIWEELDQQTVLIEDIRERLLEVETRLGVDDSGEDAEDAVVSEGAGNGGTVRD